MKKLVALSCFLMLVIALLTFSTGTAHASDGGGKRHNNFSVNPLATCSGNGCNGLYVGNTNCGNSTKLLQDSAIYQAGTSTQIGTIRFWYSYTCGTNWTQAWATITCSQVNNIYTRVHRNPGLDGPSLDEYSNGLYGGCSDTSPMIFAYNESAWGYASVVLINGDFGEQQTNAY